LTSAVPKPIMLKTEFLIRTSLTQISKMCITMSPIVPIVPKHALLIRMFMSKNPQPSIEVKFKIIAGLKWVN